MPFCFWTGKYIQMKIKSSIRLCTSKKLIIKAFYILSLNTQSHQREQPYSSDTTGDFSVQGRFLRITALYTALEKKKPSREKVFSPRYP